MYSRLHTQQGHWIGSEIQAKRRVGKDYRTNHTVALRLLVDSNARHRNRPVNLRESIEYAWVEEYHVNRVVCESRKINDTHMLAYVRYTPRLSTDGVTQCKTFMGNAQGALGFVEASTIDRCVAFIQLDTRTFVLDREWGLTNPIETHYSDEDEEEDE